MEVRDAAAFIRPIIGWLPVVGALAFVAVVWIREDKEVREAELIRAQQAAEAQKLCDDTLEAHYAHGETGQKYQEDELMKLQNILTECHRSGLMWYLDENGSEA